MYSNTNKAIFRSVLVLAAGLLATLVLIVVMFARLGNYASNQSAKALDKSLVNQCIASNIIRAEENVSHLADYNVFHFVQLRFSIPTKTQTPQQKAITAQFAGKLQSALDAKTWSPLTNCSSSPDTYGEVALYQIGRKAPPAVALSLENATRLHPEGSIP